MILQRADKQETCYACGKPIYSQQLYLQAENDEDVKLHWGCWQQ